MTGLSRWGRQERWGLSGPHPQVPPSLPTPPPCPEQRPEPLLGAHHPCAGLCRGLRLHLRLLAAQRAARRRAGGAGGRGVGSHHDHPVLHHCLDAGRWAAGGWAGGRGPDGAAAGAGCMAGGVVPPFIPTWYLRSPYATLSTPQVADLAKVLTQRLFHRYEVVKVRPVATLQGSCQGSLLGSRPCSTAAAAGTAPDPLPAASALTQEHCHQTGERPPRWVRAIDAPGNWCERVSERIEAATAVSGARHFACLDCALHAHLHALAHGVFQICLPANDDPRAAPSPATPAGLLCRDVPAHRGRGDLPPPARTRTQGGGPRPEAHAPRERLYGQQEALPHSFLPRRALRGHRCGTRHFRGGHPFVTPRSAAARLTGRLPWASQSRQQRARPPSNTPRAALNSDAQAGACIACPFHLRPSP